MPLIPGLKRQREADLGVQGQLGPHSEFQDSQGCHTEKPCLKRKQTSAVTRETKVISDFSAVSSVTSLLGCEMVVFLVFLTFKT